MKKIIALSLSLMMLFALAACGSSNGNQDNSGNEAGFTGSLPELINSIYEKKPIELMLGDPTEIDLTDAYSTNHYLGLEDGSQLKEAYFSESSIGSQAYSLVVARVNDPADTAAVAQSMFDGINQAKWVCVMADSLAVGAYDDLVMLAMIDSELDATAHTDLRNAFADVVGTDKLDVSLDRVNPDGGI